MFRFNIRDVLLATVIVGLALGWGIDHRRQLASAVRLERAFEVSAGRLGEFGCAVELEAETVLFRQDGVGLRVAIIDAPKPGNTIAGQKPGLVIVSCRSEAERRGVCKICEGV